MNANISHQLKAVWNINGFKTKNIMDLENKIKQKLIIRGFTEKQLLNNRGLIGATIDEVALMLVKNLAIHDVSNR